MILNLNGLNAYDAKINQTLLEKSLGNCKNIAPISVFIFYRYYHFINGRSMVDTLDLDNLSP